ncbi:HSP20 family protein [Anoxybacillus vitaminiphilus]|uniref:HSP20 family protein n=1 Tax=Paranoxybacillus vitaminiphilus TaxID=581036 RepID=A0A327YEC2_9BACL|nr:Hsp20/alpha crystallin family protein [Anoxybacillus vitaminiphilus]RAK18185.1 HSP20 family protein [Anoxybacillus vitaminiphilus]
MDFEKLKQWMEIAQKYHSGYFWNNVFDQDSSTKFMQEMDEERETEKQECKTVPHFPRTDIYLTDSQVIILIELPGFRKDDIQLFVSGNQLVVKGNGKSPIIPVFTIQNERIYGEFQRTIELPEPTEGKNITARFDNGLLILSYMRKYSHAERIVIE